MFVSTSPQAKPQIEKNKQSETVPDIFHISLPLGKERLATSSSLWSIAFSAKMDYNYNARMSQQFRSSQSQQQQRSKKKEDDPDLFMRLVCSSPLGYH